MRMRQHAHVHAGGVGVTQRLVALPQGFDASYHCVENVRYGCTDPGAVNFNGSANFNSVRRLRAWTRIVLGHS